MKDYNLLEVNYEYSDKEEGGAYTKGVKYYVMFPKGVDVFDVSSKMFSHYVNKPGLYNVKVSVAFVDDNYMGIFDVDVSDAEIFDE